MKTLKFICSLVTMVALSSLILISCSKKENVIPVPQNNTIAGSWRVSLYFDNNSDETSKFFGYDFTFNSNGQISATNGSNTVTGTWIQASSKFNIDFGTTAIFSDLNDNWLLEEKTATRIKMKDDNPAKNEQLQFAKL
jgi:hypothetical protein